MYANYVGPIQYDEYIKYKCCHQGYCCNVNCFEKCKYINKTLPTVTTTKPTKRYKENTHETPSLFETPQLVLPAQPVGLDIFFV